MRNSKNRKYKLKACTQAFSNPMIIKIPIKDSKNHVAKRCQRSSRLMTD